MKSNDETLWEFLWDDLMLYNATIKLPAPSSVPDLTKVTDEAIKYRDRVENQLKQTMRPTNVRS